VWPRLPLAAAMRRERALQSFASSPTADLRVACGESRLRAQPVLWIFSLRALAASEMPQEQEIWCPCAAERAVTHADRSEDHTSNSQGQTRLLLMRPVLTQNNLAFTARLALRFSLCRGSGRCGCQIYPKEIVLSRDEKPDVMAVP
ncbi:MAG: hypothetical protein WAO69_14210, partial [Aestuariivita sp.]|uniref:hypothetical protein n=1 Tax=Aestuariivita sp. TaxID=1872407 RepID=UPI003BB20104